MTTRVLIAVCFCGAVLSFGAVRWATDWRIKSQVEGWGKGGAQQSAGVGTRGSGTGEGLSGVEVLEKMGVPSGGEMEALLSKIAEIERTASSLPESRLAVLEAINGMNKNELRLFVDNASDSPDFLRMFRYDVKFAAQRLGELDPKEATALWEKRGSNYLVAGSMLAPWAVRDPQAFGAWVTSLPANLQGSTSVAVSALGRDNPEQFAALAPLLGDSPAGPSGADAAIQKMISAAGGKGDPGAALAYANSLPEGAIRERALANLAKWPGLELAQHPEVMAAVGSLPPDAARRMGEDLSASAAKLPEGPARASAFSKALKGDADKDPVAATKRLDELAGSKDYPAAVLGFVGATAGKDPAAAADWALSIGAQSAPVRRQALEGVAQAWYNKDPDGARAWVEKAPLTDQEYFILTGRVRSK